MTIPLNTMVQAPAPQMSEINNRTLRFQSKSSSIMFARAAGLRTDAQPLSSQRLTQQSSRGATVTAQSSTYSCGPKMSHCYGNHQHYNPQRELFDTLGKIIKLLSMIVEQKANDSAPPPPPAEMPMPCGSKPCYPSAPVNVTPPDTGNGNVYPPIIDNREMSVMAIISLIINMLAMLLDKIEARDKHEDVVTLPVTQPHCDVVEHCCDDSGSSQPSKNQMFRALFALLSGLMKNS